MAAEWYCAERGGEKAGPFDATELVRKFQNETFDFETAIVWRKGMDSWEPATSIPDLRPTPEATTEAVSQSQPEQPIQRQLHPVRKANFPVYLTSQIVGISMIINALASRFDLKDIVFLGHKELMEFFESSELVPSALIGIVILNGSMILGLVFLYRAWNSLHRAERPKLALVITLLMCVPIVSSFCSFIAYWRWSRDWNSFTENTRAPHMPEKLFLICCIGLVFSGYSILTMIIGFLLTWASVYHICRAVNYAHSHSSDHPRSDG